MASVNVSKFLIIVIIKLSDNVIIYFYNKNYAYNISHFRVTKQAHKHKHINHSLSNIIITQFKIQIHACALIQTHFLCPPYT